MQIDRSSMGCKAINECNPDITSIILGDQKYPRLYDWAISAA